MKKFIGEEINVDFDKPPLFHKKPTCPDGFVWRNEKFTIHELCMAWEDFSRKGSQEEKMNLEHAALTKIKGSWGVGRYYFIVDTKEGRRFEIYYDRAPEKSNDRNGHWYLLNEQIE